VQSISRQSFITNYGIEKYDFTNYTGSTPPTLITVDVFNGISVSSKIVVPDDLYNVWIAASNWTAYADYIYKASEV